MMLTGTLAGSGVASSADRAITHTYVMVIPAKTTANIAEMAREGLHWRMQVEEFFRLANQGHLPQRVAERGRFAEETLAIATDNLRLDIPGTIVAQDTDGRILGVVLYDVLAKGPRVRQGVLKLLAIEPNQLAGTPGKHQLRGIGTALTATASRQLLARGITEVVLSPLDDAAKRFWVGRGAAPCGTDSLLCITGRAKVEALIDGCRLQPCDPGGGDCVLCGLPGATDRYRLPGVRR